MTEARREEGLVRYFCTAGNGMERFVMDELKKKLEAEDVCQMPGKVLFSSSVALSRICELKAAERLFLLLKQDSAVRLPAHTSPAKAASLLQSRLLADSDQWTSAAMTWSRLQREVADRTTSVKPSGSVLRVTMRKEEETVEEKCSVESCGSRRGEKEKSGNKRHGSGKPDGAQELGKKRKRDDEEEETRSADGDLRNEGPMGNEKEEFERDRRIEGERISLMKDKDHGPPGLQLHVESSQSGRDDTVKYSGEESADSVTAAGRRENSVLQPSQIKPEPPSAVVSFKVCCKCTGSLSRCLSAQEVNRVIGVGLSRQLGWKTDLKNPQLEVNINLSDDHCLLGIPLTRQPLANRSYMKTTGLRSTVAWAIASMAQIQPGFCVVDPMCGVGTILIEAAQEHKAVCFLGADIDDGQLEKANANVEFAELGNRIHLLKASSMELPLPSASVDAVVCDLPFGRKFGTKTDMAANLPLILAEMERVLCIGGTLVLLLSPQLSCLMKKLLTNKDTEAASDLETKPHTTSPSSTQQQTRQTDPQSGLHNGAQPPLSSLKHQATLRVSLGLIDGLIHKYIKMGT